MTSFGGSIEDVRTGVAARLRARRAELVGRIFARVRDDAFGTVGARDAEYVAGLRAAVAAAVEYVLERIEHGQEGVGPIPAVALRQARRAARVGVSLDTVLRRYVVGSALLEEFVLEEADRYEYAEHPGAREALRGALRVQALALDRLLEAITGEYRDELARAGRSPEQRRAERVRGLLAGGCGATVERSEIAELDYELDAWHLGVIARGAGAREAVDCLAVSVDRRALCVVSGEETVWAWLGGQRRLEMAALERVLLGRGEVSFAVGEPARGLMGWRSTHRQAQAALVVALRRGGREKVTLTRYADVALLASVLKDEALARALIEIYVAPLEDDSGSGNGGVVLLQTLRAYLAAERNVSSTAAALQIARRTVENRLHTIEERLGRTLHPCPVEIEVALELDRIGIRALDRAGPGYGRDPLF